MATFDESNRGISRFTFEDVQSLKTKPDQSPLRVVVHLEIDCFFAQCESLRLQRDGNPPFDPNRPLGIVQAHQIVELNYPARKDGLEKLYAKWKAGQRNFISPAEAIEHCPDIVLQHVPISNDEDDQFSHPDQGYSREDHPEDTSSQRFYYNELDKVVALIRERLSNKAVKIETNRFAIIIHLSPQIWDELVRTHRGDVKCDDPTLSQNYMPLPPQGDQPSHGQRLADIDSSRNLDWDRVAMGIGSGLVQDLRDMINDKIGYTASAGIASNRVLARLAVFHEKDSIPNRQTVIVDDTKSKYLSGLSFRLVGFGSSLGNEYRRCLQTDKISELSSRTIDYLIDAIRRDVRMVPKFYDAIRGIETQQPREENRRVIRCETFSPSILNQQSAVGWLRQALQSIYDTVIAEFGKIRPSHEVTRPSKLELRICHGHEPRTGQRQTVILTADVRGGHNFTVPHLFALVDQLLLVDYTENGGRWEPAWRLSIGVHTFKRIRIDGDSGQTSVSHFWGQSKRQRQTGNDRGTPIVNESDSRPAKRPRVT